MRKIIALALATSTAFGCAAKPILNCDEGCATRGMRCTGSDLSSASASTFSYSTLNTYETKAEAETFSCKKPETPAEAQQVEIATSSANGKIEAAQKSAKTKTILLIGGIILLIGAGAGSGR
jgi:hypothetical protein